MDLDLATKGDILMHLMSGLEWRAYRRQFEYMPLLLKDIACSKNQNMRNGEGERGSAEVIVGQRLTPRRSAWTQTQTQRRSLLKLHASICMYVHLLLS